MSDRKLRLVFRGLVGFVPREKITPSSLQKSVTVLFPTALRPKVVEITANQFELTGTHRPILRFPLDRFVTDSPRQPDDRVGPDGIIFLKSDEDLFVETGNRPKGGFDIIRNTSNPDAEKPDATDKPLYLIQKNDFRWVAPMAIANPVARTVDTDCLGANRLGLVTARMILDEGILRTFRLAGGELAEEMAPDKVDIYRFPRVQHPDSVETCQALAEEVALDVTLAGSSLTIKFFDRSSPPIPRPELRLEIPIGTTTLTVCNSELEDLFPALTADDEDLATDFAIFYELSTNRPARSQRNIPRKKNTDRGGGPRICPNSAFDVVRETGS